MDNFSYDTLLSSLHGNSATVLIGLNVLLFYFLYVATINNKRLEKMLNNIESKEDAGKPLDGVFEIHIFIDPEDNYVNLLRFVKNMSKTKMMKIVHAVAYCKVNQLMISHFTRKNSEKEAIQAARYFESEMMRQNIKVVRVKIESHNTSSVPLTKKDYEKYCKYINGVYEGYGGTPYFEFHAKVGNNVAKENYYETIEDDVKHFKGVAVSYNMCSKSCKPLLTIRVFDDGYQGAQNYKDKVLDSMKEKGYIFEELQTEFSVYDTNTNLDKGWMFN